MLRQIAITNFRSFENIRLKSAKRLNVIVGKNGAGKTALLEAIFFASSNTPAAAARLLQWRGMETAYQGSTAAIEEALWGDLVREGADNAQISLSGTAPHRRALTIRLEADNRPVELDPRAKDFSTGDDSRMQFVFTYLNQKESKELRPSFAGGKPPNFEEVYDADYMSSYFAANHNYSTEETAQRFSKLDIAGREILAVEIVKAMFPDIVDISINVRGGRSVLYVTRKGWKKKIPMNFYSGGLTKVMSILLGIEVEKNSIIMIDEVENGLHYSTLPRMWTALYKSAVASNAQLFITTHSRECLDALVASCKKHLDEITLTRVTQKNGVATVEQFGGASIGPALEMGDVR